MAWFYLLLAAVFEIDILYFGDAASIVRYIGIILIIIGVIFLKIGS